MTQTGRRDLPVALVVAGAAMILYLATLQPDFGGPEDTPKFQFLGYVLGTAHPPGYPLYVMLSHLFVQLPVGSIAYRANLFSAVTAALACAFAYGIARELGARWWAAAAAAIALASGVSFWRSAVFAEVYGLAAALVTMSIFLLLRWGSRGGTHRLLGAVAFFAAGLGNHLTIVGIAPAGCLYVVIRNRSALRPRVVAVAALLCVIGVAQYGFILVRTRQGAAYLESRAESVRELVSVIRADRFARERFAFTVAEVARTKVPEVGRVLAAELMPLGLACLVVGMLGGLRRKSSSMALVLGSAAGMLGMIVNMSGDVQGFITPVVVLLWPIAALGLETACSMAPVAGRMRAVATAAVLTVAVAMPVVGLMANYKVSDQSRQTATARFLRDVYAHVPERSGMVAENYFYDMAQEYFSATEEAGPIRDVIRVGYSSAEVRAAAAEGRRVFAFAEAAATFAAEGLWFERVPLIDKSLVDWLRELPRETVVIGATALAAVPFDPAILGHPGARGPGRAAPFEAFVLTVGRGLVAWRRDEHRASIVNNEPSVATSPSHLRASLAARADDRGASVLVNGRPLADVSTGLVLAAFTPDGGPPQVVELTPGDSNQVAGSGAIYELKGETECARLTRDDWQEIGPVLSTGSAVAMLAELATATVEIRLPDGPAVADAGHLLGEGDTSVQQRRDGNELVLDWRFSRSGGRRPLFRLALDRPVRAARARIAAGSDVSAATLCSHHPWRPAATSGSTRTHISANFEDEAFFGAGWSRADRQPEGVLRRGRDRATLFVPLQSNVSYRLKLALAAETPTTIDVFVSDERAGSCRVGDEPTCEVTLPAGARDAMSLVRFVITDSPVPSGFTFFHAWFEPRR